MTATTLGKIAYDSYRDATGGVSLVSGAPLPTFEQLSGPIRAAWCIAASDVAVFVMAEAKRITTETFVELRENPEFPPQTPRFDTFSTPER